MTAHRHKNAAGKWVTVNDGVHAHPALEARIAALETATPPVILPPTLPPPPGAPLASFTVSPTAGVAPLTVTLTDTSTGTVTRQWDIGAGMFRPTTPVATVVLPAADNWDVVLTVTGPGGTSTAASVIAVTAPAVTPPVVIPPPIPGPLPTGKTVEVAPGQDIQAALDDATIDTLVLRDGTYTGGTLYAPARPSSKPLRITAAHRHAAILSRWLWYGGGTTPRPSSWVTTEGLSFQGNSPGETGIIVLGYGSVTDCDFLNLDFRGNHGRPGTEFANNDHHFYISRGAHHRILIDGLTVVGPGDGSMTAIHTYHDEDGPRSDIVIRNFDIGGRLQGGIVMWQDATGVLIEDGIIRGPGMAYDFRHDPGHTGPQGIMRRVQLLDGATAGPVTAPMSIQ